MAKKSAKQQMYESIANSQVQKVLQQQQAQELAKIQADFSAFQQQQRNPEALLADFNAWKTTPQSQQTQQVTKSVPKVEPIKFATAAERQALAKSQVIGGDAPFDPDKSYEKTYGKSGLKEAARNIGGGVNQIPEVLDTLKSSKKKEEEKKAILKEIAKDESPKKSYMDIYTEQSLKRGEQDPEVRAARTMLKSQDIANNMLDITGANQQNDLGLAMPSYTPKKTEIKEEAVDNRTDDEKIAQWLDPSYKMSDKEKAEARDIAQERLSKFNKKNGYPDITSAEDKAEYANMVNLLNKTSKIANTMQGFITPYYNLGKYIADGANSLRQKLFPNEEAQAEYEAAKNNFALAGKNAEAQNPGLYSGAKVAGNMSQYALTSPATKAVGAIAGLGKGGQIALNQGVQALQDLGLDILPEAQEMLQNTGKIDWNELVKRYGTDLAANAAMEAVPFLGGANYDYLAKTVGNNADIFKTMDASGAVRNVPDAIREIDDLVNGATRQANEAAANIDNLARQIPAVEKPVDSLDQFSDIMRRYNTETPSMRNIYTADDLNKSIDNQFSELMKQRPQEPANLIPSVEELRELEREASVMDEIPDYSNIWRNTDDVKLSDAEINNLLSGMEPTNEISKVEVPTVNKPTTPKVDLPEEVSDKMASDLYEIYEALDKMSKDAIATGDLDITRKYAALVNKVDIYENKLYKAEDLVEVNKAKKAADAARQQFIRAMKKYDPNYTGELTGTKLGNAEFRRTGAALKEQEAKELAQSFIDADNALNVNANKYVRDAQPDNVNIYRGVNDISEVKAQQPKNLEIQELHDSKGRTRYRVAERISENMTQPVESKTYKSIDEANEAIYNLQYFAGDSTKAEPNWKVSKAYTNTSANGGGWNADEMAKHTKEHNYLYETIDEQRSVEEATRMRAEEGRQAFKNRVMYSDRVSSVEIDGLMMEWRELVEEARAAEAAGKRSEKYWAEANKIFRKVQEQSTDNAQALQALAKWSRNTPEGMLVNAENIINGKTKVKGNSELQKKLEQFAKRNKRSFEFSPEFTKTFLDEAEKLQGLDPNSREAREGMAKLGKMVNEQIPVKLNEKLQTYLMDNMLGNFRTLISRNAGGNVGLNAVEQTLQRPLAAGIDSLLAKKTGRRTQAGLSVEGLSEYFQGFKKGLSDELTDAKTGLHTARTGENTLEQAISSNRRIFKSKLLNLKDQLVRHGLSIGDRPFYESIYKQTMGDYQRLYDRGLMGETVQKLSPKEFKEYSEVAAHLNALGAVYQQNTKLSDALLEFKRAVGQLSEGTIGVDILSQFSMPFVKTPANVIERAIDYSPLGLVRNAFRTGKEINAGVFDQNRFANETARNILGTGLMGGGVALAANGTLSGAYSDDKDRKQAQKESGQQEYALNLPAVDGKKRQLDISWIPVVGSNLVASAAAHEAYKNGEGDLVGNLATGLTKGGEALFDQSMFQGLQRLFGSDNSYNSDQGIVGNMAETVKSGLGQFIPSLARQTAQVMDPYMRDSSNSNKDLSFGPMGNYDINSLINNIPYLREQLLAPKVNTQGELMMENQGRGLGSKVLEDMILPGKLTEIETGPLYDEAMRLSEANDSNKAFLPKADFKAVQEEGHTMTNDEWVDYQQKYYKAMDSGANQIIQSDFYNSLDDAEKEKLLGNTYSDIKSVINSEYTGKELTGAAKVYAEAGGGEKGIKALETYYHAKSLANAAGTNTGSKTYESIEKALERGDTQTAERIADKEARYTEAVKAAGIDKSEGAKKAFESGGTAGVKQYAKYKTTLDKLGLENSETNRKLLDQYGEAGLKQLESFKSYGDNKNTAYKIYQNAKTVIPGLSVDQFKQQYDKIDGSGEKGNKNGSVTQGEMISYLNSGNYTEAEASNLWKAYGNAWKATLYKTKKGKWAYKTK